VELKLIKVKHQFLDVMMKHLQKDLMIWLICVREIMQEDVDLQNGDQLLKLVMIYQVKKL